MSDQAEIAQDFIDAGRKLFAKECIFLGSAAEFQQLPRPGRCEIAFSGRSNVGKSSLINALTNRKGLAKTSRTPGRTQALNFFALGGEPVLNIVDMPGYGYAAAPKDMVENWTRFVRDYWRRRAGLARVFVLVDARHGLKPVDFDTFDVLDQAAVSYQVVLTKGDCLRSIQRDRRLAEAEAALARRPAAFPQVILTSTADGRGIEDLRAAIARLLAEIGHQGVH